MTLHSAEENGKGHQIRLLRPLNANEERVLAAMRTAPQQAWCIGDLIAALGYPHPYRRHSLLVTLRSMFSGPLGSGGIYTPLYSLERRGLITSRKATDADIAVSPDLTRRRAELLVEKGHEADRVRVYLLAS